MSLKNRINLGTTLDLKLSNSFREFSKVTRIPLSKLVDEAIEDLLIKYGRLESVENKHPQNN